jgi:hypothetical protein
MRVYLPATISLLTRLEQDGELTLDHGYAVTGTLRAWYAEGDEEELEYAALVAAARASLRLLADVQAQLTGTQAEPAEVRDVPLRRVVVAADVPEARVRAASVEDDRGPGVIDLTGVVRLIDIASLHVDDAGAQEYVLAAARAVHAADKGDADASFAVDAVEDYDLLWYATQEIRDLV